MSNLKKLSARTLIRNEVHTEDLKILGTNLQNGSFQAFAMF